MRRLSRRSPITSVTVSPTERCNCASAVGEANKPSPSKPGSAAPPAARVPTRSGSSSALRSASMPMIRSAPERARARLPARGVPSSTVASTSSSGAASATAGSVAMRPYQDSSNPSGGPRTDRSAAPDRLRSAAENSASAEALIRYTAVPRATPVAIAATWIRARAGWARARPPAKCVSSQHDAVSFTARRRAARARLQAARAPAAARGRPSARPLPSE